MGSSTMALILILVLLSLLLPSMSVEEDLERREASGERGEEGTGGTVVEQSIDVRRGSNQNFDKKAKDRRHRRRKKLGVPSQSKIMNTSTNEKVKTKDRNGFFKSKRKSFERGKGKVTKRRRRIKQLQEPFQKNKQMKESKDNDNNKHANEADYEVTIVLNYNKEAIRKVLENKEEKVGNIILVNGKPAVIKKRKKYPKNFSNKKISKDRKLFARKLLNNRRIVRVKVRAQPGRIKLERRKELAAANVTYNQLDSFEDLQSLSNKSTKLKKSGKKQLERMLEQSTLPEIVGSSASSKTQPRLRAQNHHLVNTADNINYHTGSFTLSTVG